MNINIFIYEENCIWIHFHTHKTLIIILLYIFLGKILCIYIDLDTRSEFLIKYIFVLMILFFFTFINET